MNLLTNNNATAAVILMIDSMFSSALGRGSSHLSSSLATPTVASISGMVSSSFFQYRYLLSCFIAPLLLLWVTHNAYVYITSARDGGDGLGLADDDDTDKVAEIVAELNTENEKLRKAASSLSRVVKKLSKDLSLKEEQIVTLNRRLEDAANGVYVFNAGVAPRSEGSDSGVLPGCISPRGSAVKFDANYFEGNLVDGSSGSGSGSGPGSTSGRRTSLRRSASDRSLKKRNSSRLSTTVEEGKWDFAI